MHGWAMAVLAKVLQLPDCAACTTQHVQDAACCTNSHYYHYGRRVGLEQDCESGRTRATTTRKRLGAGLADGWQMFFGGTSLAPVTSTSTIDQGERDRGQLWG